MAVTNLTAHLSPGEHRSSDAVPETHWQGKWATAIMSGNDQFRGAGMNTRDQHHYGIQHYYGTGDQHHHGSVMGWIMWACQASLWVLLAGLVIAALLRWAL